VRAHRGGIAERKMMKADLALIRQIDQLHLEHPFMGQRMLVRQLKRQGVQVGRLHVRTLMQRMGICALAPQPGTSPPVHQSISPSVHQSISPSVHQSTSARHQKLFLSILNFVIYALKLARMSPVASADH